MNPRLKLFFIVVVVALGSGRVAWSQCNALRPQIDISFNTDQDCAPVTVTQFTITYYFNVPQNPAQIEIQYEWNDPGNTVTTLNTGTGVTAGATASGPNTSFTANSTFTYFDNNGQCSIRPTASIIINGILCPSSSETQLAFFGVQMSKRMPTLRWLLQTGMCVLIILSLMLSLMMLQNLTVTSLWSPITLTGLPGTHSLYTAQIITRLRLSVTSP
jgi:hypothetical protein